MLSKFSIQLLLFIILGFCCFWASDCFSTKKIHATITAITTDVIFGVFSYFKLRSSTFPLKIQAEIAGLFLGSILFAFVWLFERLTENEEVILLKPISTYRSQVMGFAMLCVIFFHTKTMKAVYPIDILDFVINSGNSGVDIFIFLSGIGMVYSLSKNWNPLLFYKKRLLRIFPTYIPLVGIYTLVCIFKGLCDWSLLPLNCLGVAYWFKTGAAVFNWYIPAMLLFYLSAPFIYQCIKKENIRYISSFVLISIMVALIIVMQKLSPGHAIAWSRYPIFLIGMIFGFALKENKSINKSEYFSMICSIGILYVIYYIREKTKAPLLAWHWLLFAFIVPPFCLAASRLLSRFNPNSWWQHGLKWLGDNSLVIYILNVIIVRFSRMFFMDILKSPTKCIPFCMVAIVVNILAAYLYEKTKKVVSGALNKKQ